MSLAGAESGMSFHTEDSPGAWTQSPLTDTNRLTKVAFERSVPLPDHFASCKIELMSISFHIDNSLGTKHRVQ